jgi:polyisoprenyl-teichoic acid--peptidoglycan teichoic acid transferase
VNEQPPSRLTDPTGTPRPGSARERMQRRRQMQQDERPRPKLNLTTAVIGVASLAIVLIVIIIISAVSSPQSNSNARATATLIAFGITPQKPQATSTVDLSTLNLKAWDGKERLTVLVMGLDKRPDEIGTGFRTDTLILVSIDPKTKSIGMLSIPRDLYVAVPNQPDLQRVNTAYVIGELERPGGGPMKSMQVVQYNLGIPIHHYVAVSFESVIGVIDAIGGVDIDVPVEIDDPLYPNMSYGYEPLRIPVGLVHMDGNLALKYARTRHQGTDYDRAQRQQQVILAIRQKALKADVLPGLVGQAPTLWNELSKGILTDFAFDQILSLGWYVKDISADNIKRGAIDGTYLEARQYNGETIVTPNRNTIGQLMAQIFGEDYNR